MDTNILIGILVLTFGAICFVGLVTFGWVVSVYNRLRTFQQDIKTQWSNILTEAQRRYDLFYNLVETTKGHAKFEKSTLTEVTKMRNVNSFMGELGKLGSGSIKQQFSKLGQLENLFSRLLVTVERYPKLRSMKLYEELMENIRITEDRMNIARTSFNDIIREYNVVVTVFPSNIIAGIFSFKEEKFFINEEVSNKAPKINMNLD